VRDKRRRHRVEWESFTRKNIQEAVIRILSRQGSAALTMERVAAEAGLAKGTLYAYFKDKKQLLESVKETSLQPMREELFSLLESDLSPERKLEGLITRHLGYFDENRGFFRVLLWERQLASIHLRRQQSTYYQNFVDRVARVFAEGVKKGIFKPLDPVKVALMIIEANIAMVGQRLLKDNPAPVEEDAGLLIDVFMQGVKAPRRANKRKS
jgi:AcrR family transcriptional regulator